MIVVSGLARLANLRAGNGSVEARYTRPLSRALLGKVVGYERRWLDS